MTRYVAFLRGVNVTRSRRVSMPAAREVLEDLGYDDVSSYANTGNLPFTATGKSADLQDTIRKAMEKRFDIELTTFVRTATQVRKLAIAQARCAHEEGSMSQTAPTPLPCVCRR